MSFPSVVWGRAPDFSNLMHFRLKREAFLRRFTGDFFEKIFLLKFMKNILQYTIDYPNVIYRKKLGVTDSGF